MITDDGKRVDRAASLEPIDVHVAGRVRQARNSRGWSRLKLAEEIGLSDQQITKWELPSNRMYVSRLYAVSQALGYPIGWFFEGFRSLAARIPAMNATASPGADVLSLLTPETIRLLEQYTALTPTRQRLVRQFLGEMQPVAEAASGATAAPAEQEDGPFAVRV
ncbi:MAG: helix-turn-helix domain-containing protein [Aquidulcibacter sp.]|jgi:transcriptional regulator with XRE-family HTH domain